VAQDFAKNRRPSATGKKRAPTHKKQPSRGRGNGVQNRTSPGGGWRNYGAGVLTGFFLSFLLYLGTLPPTGSSDQGPASPDSQAQVPKPRFDFYTLLPEQTMEVEPVAAVKPRGSSATEFYLVQAGSFRQREDADRRRAELLLLGLEPTVEETSGDNGRWFRVYLGPFDSRSRMAKARSLTAAQDIDTLLLKRSKP
jgi:hypothetical protein